MTHTDPIKALEDDAFRVEQIYKWTNPHDITPEGWQFIIKMARKGAAIEALTPIAAGGSVVVPVEPTEAICEKLRAVLPELFDTSDDTLREIYIDMLAAASPSASTGKDGVVERVARAIAKVIGDDDWEKADYFICTADDTIQTTQDLYRDLARAALAAINGENEHGK